MAARSRAVAKQGKAELAKAYDYGREADAGFEGTTGDDYAIPFIGILQKLSPLCDSDNDAYDKDASPGMIVNNVTKDYWPGGRDDKPSLFIPVYRERKFLEWVPRDAGGGLVSIHDPDSMVVATAKEQSEDGFKLMVGENSLADTFYVYGLLRSPRTGDAWEQCAIPFSSTQIKKYRAWMTRAKSIVMFRDDGSRFTPPLFAHVYRIHTVKESNASGIWHGWNITFGAPSAEECRLAPDSQDYTDAVEFRELIIAGKVTVTQSPDDDDQTQGDDSSM